MASGEGVNAELIQRNRSLLSYLEHISTTLNKRKAPKSTVLAHEEHVTTVRMTLRVLTGESY